MAAKYILSLLAIVFSCAAVWHWVFHDFKLVAASRTWIVVALIFAVVSVWLWWNESN